MTPKLSILIAAYDMQREIPRTLASALPPLQRGVDASEYEIVVVDNGSPTPLALPSDLAEAVTLVRVPREEARPSPVHAINAAIRDVCRGEMLLVCIDGARLLSAWLVRRTLDALARWPDGATFVQSRHLGAEVQMKAVARGYDQAAEDLLLATVPWREDLDVLWGISVLAGCHDRKRPVLQNESNAIGLHRRTWEALGGYREGFARPGGGLCNLELFNRVLGRPGGPTLLLEGEATFHQVHGGAATANPGYFKASQDEYRAVTGRDYARPDRSFLIAPAAAYDRKPRR